MPPGAYPAERYGQGEEHDPEGDQADQPPGGARRVHPPPDGDAMRRNRPIPADTATAASQSRRLTLTPRPRDGHGGEDEKKLQRQDGLDQGQRPEAQGADLETNLRIMLATPSSQTGRRASRTTSQTSKPVTSLLLAPMRWHTEAVAVQKLAAKASRIAFFRSGRTERLRQFATHHLPLEEAPHGYEIFRDKADGCLKVVLQPWPQPSAASE